MVELLKGIFLFAMLFCVIVVLPISCVHAINKDNADRKAFRESRHCKLVEQGVFTNTYACDDGLKITTLDDDK